uniref:Non-specific serine/threonine protein kinase (EC) n=1 Tax=Ganoderma boninense TaxID=34458 RepID=A0A5K1JX63_9APHY|nr:Non-specific serine/threonine protein kinase (EC [Ganoderma boninense]
MKYSHSLAVLFALLPVFAQAVPAGNFRGGKGFQGKGGNNANKGGNAASTSSAAAAASSSAAASNNNSGSNNNSNDAQSSLTLLSSVIAKGFENNGQDVAEAGQVASLTSSNNFINFCATVPNLPITNGQQITTGSCNPAPMGVIAAQSNMPSAKFVFPKNGQTIAANQDFTIQMAIQHLNTGAFVNPNENFFAAPQTVASNGDITGHSHVVVEALTALDQTSPLDPTKFAFFKGLNSAAQNGVLSADVAGGLPAGVYRLASINSAANHQPVLVAVAQHGSLDDMVYFTVSENGASSTSGNNNTGSASSAAASSTASVGSIKGKNTGKGGAQGGFTGGKGRGRA